MLSERIRRLADGVTPRQLTPEDQKQLMILQLSSSLAEHRGKAHDGQSVSGCGTCDFLVRRIASYQSRQL